MDIAALSMSMSMQNLGTQVSIAVLNMGKQIMQDNSNQMMDMMKSMEQSVNPHVGSQIDISL